MGDLKITGILSHVNGVPINSASNKLLLLLNKIEREHPKVFIKKGELQRLAPGQFNPQKVSKSQSKNAKKKSKLSLNILLQKWGVKIKIVLALGVLAIVAFFAYLSLSDSYEDSPLSQVTSWQNSQAKEWAVYLRSYQTLEDAKLEQESFSNRTIAIFKLDNGRFYLFVLANSEAEAQRKFTSTVKDHWRRSRVIPFDRCTQRYYLSEGYFVCE